MSLLRAIKSALAGEKQQSSSESARQRLHILLINDRIGMNTPDFLPKLREEIIAVISKYVPTVTGENVEINYSNTDEAHIIEMSVSLEGEEKK